jgi:very-short-patch-repair endonuclease
VVDIADSKSSPALSWIFLYHARDLVIEGDDDIHQSQKEYDAERDKILSGMGLRILRYSNQDSLRNLPHGLKSIGELYIEPQRLIHGSPGNGLSLGGYL